MYRPSVTHPLFRVNNMAMRRSFSAVVTRMGEGDTGAPRTAPSGRQIDVWSDREQIQEAFFVRQRELEKLKAFKDKLAKKGQHFDDLDVHIKELTKEQGGEHN